MRLIRRLHILVLIVATTAFLNLTLASSKVKPTSFPTTEPSRRQINDDDISVMDDLVTGDDYHDDFYIGVNPNTSIIGLRTNAPFGIKHCIIALEGITDIDTVSVANSATSTMTNFTFWASDLGNYDLCMGFPTLEDNTLQSANVLRHCIAGATQDGMTTDESNPFAGLCVPYACGPQQLMNKSLVTYVHEKLDRLTTVVTNSSLRGVFAQQQVSYYMKLDAILQYGLSTQSSYICGSSAHPMTIDRWLILLVFAGLFLSTLLATFFHMAIRKGKDEQTAFPSWIEESRILQKVLNAFSLVRNIPLIFSVTSKSSERFPVLDGLRVLSILWIILAHTLALSTGIGLLNPGYVFPPTGFLTLWSSQIFFSARFAVDTFFFISGFLVVNTMLKRLVPIEETPLTLHEASSPSWQWIPMMYVHRLMRILPLYITCLLIWWKLGVVMGEGPLWYHWEAYTVQCNLYWWTNVLFINNLYPYSLLDTGECLYVSWYLANDMQFFVLSPFFVLIYKYNAYLGLLAAVGVCILSCALAFCGTLWYDWSAHSFDGLWVTDYTMYVYTKPQYRIASYAVGIACAMLWHSKKRRFPDFKVSVELARCLMAAAVAGIVFLVFGASSAYQLAPCNYYQSSTENAPCGSNWSLLARAFYVGFTRAAWAVCIGVIVLLSGNDQGDLVQGFLSHAVWGAPAKLTFAVFLIHVTVLNVWFYGNGEKLHFTQWDLYMSYAAVVFVSFLASLFVTVLVESPWNLFAKVIEKSLSSALLTSNRNGTKHSTARECENRNTGYDGAKYEEIPNIIVESELSHIEVRDCKPQNSDYELSYQGESNTLSWNT